MTTKRKRTVPAKRKSAVPAKEKHAVPSHETATGHWTQRIEPRGTALLSQTLGPIYFVIKNRSPNGVFLMAQYGDLMDLPPGKVRATYAAGTITVENRSEKSALIEFDFLPIYKK
jgi:hypothetical protein